MYARKRLLFPSMSESEKENAKFDFISMRALCHPHITRLHEVYSCGGGTHEVFFLVSEYHEGGTL
jgi:hypothetical protein